MKILIIDDDKEIVKFLKPSLEAEFYVVDQAHDGEKGSFMARTNHYDLIILDYMMPKQNGLETLKEIRKDKVQSYIIALTVKSELKDKSNLFKAGADDYLTKPFIFEELLLRIKAISKRPPLKNIKILALDNLKLEVDSQEVYRGKKKIYLTRKEFCLLEYFLNNINKVLSRALILENVWDINADPFSNTIESHILNLRKKIEAPGKTKLIHTVAGRGYKMALKL
ncbi:MAG: response regulator transcription factor [Parcubacteria group bacterium]